MFEVMIDLSCCIKFNSPLPALIFLSLMKEFSPPFPLISSLPPFGNEGEAPFPHEFSLQTDPGNQGGCPCYSHLPQLSPLERSSFEIQLYYCPVDNLIKKF